MTKTRTPTATILTYTRTELMEMAKLDFALHLTLDLLSAANEAGLAGRKVTDIERHDSVADHRIYFKLVYAKRGPVMGWWKRLFWRWP